MLAQQVIGSDLFGIAGRITRVGTHGVGQKHAEINAGTRIQIANSRLHLRQVR